MQKIDPVNPGRKAYGLIAKTKKSQLKLQKINTV